MDGRALTEKIKAMGKALGIDMIGITSAEPFEDLRDLLLQREGAGKLSGFEHPCLEERIDPRLTLSTAQSIIAIGQSYYVPMERTAPSPNTPRGTLARVSWGRDYHLVLKELLEALAGQIQALVPDFQYRAFSDTGPLVDRHVAFRAGLGWYGLNGLLINETYGSWFSIGYMITNLPLVADGPLERQSCIQCGRCIAACPGRAIAPNYGFDANRCLSCRLQKKEAIPLEDRPRFETRLYGCDTCQLVCPHNRGVAPATHGDFRVKDTDLAAAEDIGQLLTMGNKEFKEVYGVRSAGWRGKRVLQRNGIMALVNQGNPEAAQLLLPLIKDPRPEIQQEALWGLVTLNPTLGREVLASLKASNRDQRLVEQLEKLLENC